MSATSTGVVGVLRAWRRQRVPHALFIPVALTLVIASLVGGVPPTPEALVARFAAAYVAVVGLRLWDDLQDRVLDAADHPDRVLTQVSNARPYFGAAAGLMLVAAGLTFLGGGLPVVYVPLVVGLAVLYRFKRHLHGQAAAPSLLVLVKYPVIAFALGGNATLASLAAFAVTLTAVMLDELLQDDRSTPAIMASLAALVAACGVMLAVAQTSLIAVALGSAAVFAMVALTAATVFGRVRGKHARGGLLTLTFGTLLIASPVSEMLHAH